MEFEARPKGDFVVGKNMGKFLVVGVILLLLFILLVNCIVVVKPGTVRVQILFGKVFDKPLREGLHFVNPLINFETLTIRLQEYTMSIAREEGRIRGDDAIDALTRDGLKIKLDLTGWFRVEPDGAPNLFRTIGPDYERKIVRPVLRTAIRDTVVNYSAEAIYSESRGEVVDAILQLSRELIEGKGIIIGKILLRNVKLPQLLEDAINAKVTMEQDAQKMKFVLQKEEQEKKRKVVEAEGIRRANQIISAGLTSAYIKWYRIEMMKQLINSPNNTIIFVPEDMSMSPIIDTRGK